MVIHLLTAFLVSLLCVNSVFAEGFFTVYGGGAFPEQFQDVQGRGNLSGLSVGDVKLRDTNFIGGFKLGFFGGEGVKWLGFEIDGSYTPLEIKGQQVRGTLGNTPVLVAFRESRVNLFTGAAHLLLRYPGEVVQPYIGAGPAVIHARLEDGFASSNSESATNIGLSGVAGLRFRISEHFGMLVEYKHIRSQVEFGDVKGDAVVHAGVLGLSVLF